MTYHEGGYSHSVRTLQMCVEKGDNLVIACSNEMKDSVSAVCRLYILWRAGCTEVNLISVPDAHFDLEYYGGPEIQVTPKTV